MVSDAQGLDTKSRSDKTAGQDLLACPMSSIEPLSSFDWTAKEPLKMRPFKPKYHITMGKISYSST